MPVKLTPVGGGKVRVSTPHGVKARATTPAKAKAQRNLLNAVEHSDWRPTGKKALARGYSKPKMKHYQEGGFVAKTGPAILEKGERVLPAPNAAERSMQDTEGKAIVRQAQKNARETGSYEVKTGFGSRTMPHVPQIDPGIYDTVLKEKGK